LFLASFPDLGAARIAASLERQGVGCDFLGGNDHWLDFLLGDPDRVETSLERIRPGGRAQRLVPVARRGTRHLSETLKEARRLLEAHHPGMFFDVSRVERAVELLEAAFALRCAEAGQGEAIRESPMVDRLVREILRRSPSLVAFSIAGFGDPVTRAVISRLAGRGVPTVGGGWITLGLDIERLERERKRLGLDWLVAGPGEEILPEIYAAAQNAEASLDAPNTVGRGVGRPRMGQAASKVIRPSFEPFMQRSYLAPYPVAPVSSNQGCYWKKCSFCPQAHNSHPYVEREPTEVADEMAEARSRFGVDDFFFVDECISPGFARGLSRELTRRGETGARMTCMARPERGFDSSLLGEMAQAGFRSISWGVESGSARVLALMKKGTTPRTIEEVLRRSREAGIASYAFLMIGFPGETEDERDQTFDWVTRMREWIDGFQLSRFVVYRSSEVGLEPGEYGLTLGEPSSEREVNSLSIAGKEWQRTRKELDELHRLVERRYDEMVSGRFVSVLNRYYSARALLMLMYQAHRGEIAGERAEELAPAMLQARDKREERLDGKRPLGDLGEGEGEMARTAAAEGRVVWLTP
jgi:hypothetical protein